MAPSTDTRHVWWPKDSRSNMVWTMKTPLVRWWRLPSYASYCHLLSPKVGPCNNLMYKHILAWHFRRRGLHEAAIGLLWSKTSSVCVQAWQGTLWTKAGTTGLICKVVPATYDPWVHCIQVRHIIVLLQLGRALVMYVLVYVDDLIVASSLADATTTLLKHL